MRARYDLILLDADGTVLDFTRAQRYAVEKLMAALRLPFDEGILDKYDQINESYWRLLEQGAVTKEELTVRRFVDFLEYLGQDGDPAEMNRHYLDNLADTGFCLEGAEDICRLLARHCTLAIATNGVSRVQKGRLEKSSISPYISHLIVSEEAGALKPQARFFDFAFARCGAPDKDRVLMVGDSLGADIRGGVDYGIHTCWCNFFGQPEPEDLQSTYVISHISQLADVVLER